MGWRAERLCVQFRGTDDTVSVFAPSYGTKNVMLLAMHYAPDSRTIESDTNRIRSFLNDGWSVCSVDLQGHQNTLGHISANFTTQRGIKSIIRSCEGMPPSIIILDYFWLQQNYYEERYGEDWPEKCKLLFANFSALRAVILPIDNPDSRPSSMLRQRRRFGGELAYFEISADDADLNPLVRYTLASNDTDSIFQHDRSHAAQKWRIRGFYVVHRASDARTNVETALKM